MSEIKTIKETLPLKSNTEQKNNHYIPVWEYAGEILKKYDLERNGELQYALFKWLRKHNTQEAPSQPSPREGTEKVPFFYDQNGKCLRFVTSLSANRLNKAKIDR